VEKRLATVFHFFIDYRIGGNHIYANFLKKSLPKNFKSIFVTTGKGEMTDIPLFSIRHLWSPLYLLEIVLNIILLVFLITKRPLSKSARIFHVHGGANISPIIVARLLKIPVVWTIHETIPSYQFFIKCGLFFLRGSSYKLVVVAESSKNSYQGITDATFIPSAVDLKYWHKIKNVNELNHWSDMRKSKSILRILCVGNINPLKGFDLLLNALGQASFKWELKIVGARLETHERYFQNLSDKSKHLELIGSGKVIFLYWQSSDAIRNLMNSCDVFVLPSRSEASPIVLLEAMSMKCHCIASDVGDISNILLNYPYGYLFSKESISDLLNKLSLVFNKKNKKKET
jgi:glycosyltransferase involved in cell wall biosynthesis